MTRHTHRRRATARDQLRPESESQEGSWLACKFAAPCGHCAKSKAAIGKHKSESKILNRLLARTPKATKIQNSKLWEPMHTSWGWGRESKIQNLQSLFAGRESSKNPKFRFAKSPSMKLEARAWEFKIQNPQQVGEKELIDKNQNPKLQKSFEGKEGTLQNSEFAGSRTIEKTMRFSN